MAKIDTTGILSQETKHILRDALLRGVTNVGITGIGADGSKEIIGSKEQMIRVRLPQRDKNGLKKIISAYRKYNGRHIWICPAGDTRPESNGWAQDNAAPDERTIAGAVYTTLKCRDRLVQDEVCDILAGYGVQSIALPDSVIMAPVVYRTGAHAEEDELIQAQQMAAAISVIAGGGVSLLSATEFVDITDPADRMWGEMSQPLGIGQVHTIADTVSAMEADEDFLTEDDILGYLDDRKLEYTDEGAYAGYGRYKTRYGIILINADGTVALAPAAGSKVRTWDQLRRILDVQPDESDIKTVQEALAKGS